ncbi:equilibrative nucleobase transporter 1-like isoform X1 [Rhopilema esculentum]|uniref:equilibrative nucleobase transporter 1-like isoform X1 n=1 Tax=Rhopilema esculentum TaxID=499914 RepID=UPI0031DAFD0A
MPLYKLGNKTIFQSVYFVFTVLEILLLSGITYGWASVVVVFQYEGFFNYLCPKENGTVNGMKSLQQTNATSLGFLGRQRGYEEIVCSQQSKRFNLVFNISVACLCCFKFPIGLFIDKYGPRAGQILGCSIYVIGGLGLAFITKETAFILFPTFILFCIGGGLIAVAKYQVCRYIYTDVRSLVLSILHGTFDSSAVILVFFKLAWESGISLRDISLFYIVLSFILVSLSTFALTPPYDQLKNENGSSECTIISERDIDENSNSKKLSAPDSLIKSITSPLFLLELVFMCFCQLRLWFFIGSLEELISVHFPDNEESVNHYSTYFGYAQLCGILVGPLIGYLFDKDTIKCKRDNFDDKSPLLDVPEKRRVERMQAGVLPFFLTNLLCAAFALLSLAPWSWGLIPSFILQVMTRGFLYSAHASYIAMTFRPEYFATLYGLGIFVAGFFGLLEYPLYTITYRFCGSDPFWVNLVLLFLVLFTNIFPFYLLYHCRIMKNSIYTSLVKFDKASNGIFVKV